MRRDERSWGRRRPATRSRKPYNDDYKDDYDDYDDEIYDSYDEDTTSGSGSRYDYEDTPEDTGRRQNYAYEDRRRDTGRRQNYAYEDRRQDTGRGQNYAYDDDYAEEEDVKIYTPGRESGYGEEHTPVSRRDEEPVPAPARRVRRREEAPAPSRRRRRREYSSEPASGRGRGPGCGLGCGVGCLIPIIVLLIILGLGVLGFAYVGSLWSKVDNANFRASDVAVNPDLPGTVKEFTKNYTTIMIFGVDSRDNDTLQAGALADSNILAAINKKTGDVKLLSIYRDLYVETTDEEHMKLTEVYMKYGAKEQLQTINKNFDLNISEYVTVNWKSVADVINSLGGIDIDLSSDECKGINRYIDEVIESTGVSSEHVSVEDGRQHLDGVQAVTFCRLRKGLGDDYKRTERQREVLALTLSKAKSAGIPKVLEICNEVFPGISSSLSLTDVMGMAAGMSRYEITDASGFPFDQESQDGGKYYLFPVTLASNAKKLHEYLYNNTAYEPSGTVQNLSEAISAYSGY